MRKAIKAATNKDEKINFNLIASDDFVLNIEAAQAAGDDGKVKNRKFEMVAYTGGPMRVSGWGDPVVVDLKGLSITQKSKPIFYGHQQDLGSLLGQTSSIKVVDGQLIASGEILGESDTAKQVIALHDKGFKWQASIGARADKSELLGENETAKVNGQDITGPAIIVRKSILGEISFVTLGADEATSASIAANKNNDFINQKELSMENDKKTVEASADVKAAATKEVDVVADIRAKAAAEVSRISAIKVACKGNAEIEAKAIAEGWAPEKAQLEALLAATPTAPAVVVRKAPEGNVIEAAIMLSGGLNATECAKRYGDQTVEAAQKQFRHGIGLQQVLMEKAWENGSPIRSFREDPSGVLKAAFSTSSLSGILSNVANKYLLAGFNSVEQTWRKISRIRPCSDFKTLTSYRLNGSFTYDEVGAGGELKHADLSEESYTNQAKTYGKIVGITRQDIINDDLGALTSVPQKLGRGAGLKFNTVFWTAFLNNSAFFTAARGNYTSGASTALSVDSLTTLVGLFKKIKDAKGVYTGLDPAILLVPSDIEGTADAIFKSQFVIAVGTPANNAVNKYPAQNIHAGKYEVASSRYLSDSSISGYSAVAHYLLANPADAAAMEVLFLNGQEQPTVQQADADFDTLGIQMRGYHDFGCALAEWQAGMMSKGSA